MGDFERTVQEMTIPNQLKEYLISSKTVRNIATKEILNDIEDLFILYSSHYFFDTTDFSLNTIQTLKRVPCPNPIYRYLQTVIENNMFLISKGDEDNYTLLENTLIEEVLDSSITSFSNLIEENDHDQLNKELSEFYKGMGKLEVLNQITNDETCKSLYTIALSLVEKYQYDISNNDENTSDNDDT